MTSNDLILTIGRLSSDRRRPDLIHSLVTDYFFDKGQTSLPKWQINSVVRSVLGEKTQVTHDDLHTLEAEIRRKETGLPGSKLSPGAFKKIDIRRGLANGLRASDATGGSPLASGGSSLIHQKRSSISSQKI